MLELATDFLWTWVLITVLIVIGMVFTVGSRFVQIRYFAEMFRVLGQAFRHQPGRVSSFPALPLGAAGGVGAAGVAGVGGARARRGVLDVGGWAHRHGHQLF